jgi:hypothetical protein
MTPYYFTIAQLEALKPNALAKTILFCEESGYHYYYANSASGSTIDGETVLNTGNGGNSRWIAANAQNPAGLNIIGLTEETDIDIDADYLPIYSDSASANRKANASNLLANHPGVATAWVNFDGTTAANVSGTYSRTGTTVTVTLADHGHIAGHVIYADFTSGAASDGLFTISSVIDANTFTFTHGSSGTTSGNVTFLRRLIRGSLNIHSVTYRNSAGRFHGNFLRAMVNSNYSVAALSQAETSGGTPGRPSTLHSANTAQQFRLYYSTGNQDSGDNSGTGIDVPTMNALIFSE